MSRGMIEPKGSHTAVRICSNVEPGETVVIITTVLENLTYYLGDLKG